MNKCKLISVIFILFLFFNIVLSFPVRGWCKDIVAVGDATAGEYNLLLKIRDPSRRGLQVLCIVDSGYKYDYHHPWTGKPMVFKVKHKFIGVATIGDTIPNVVKAGMAFSDAGIAYGDADTLSIWRNPTRYGWDDFDWIRYACQEADTEEEACTLMTKDVVDQLHAPAVPENLFIVGPKKAYLIEADVVRYVMKEIEGVVVMTNFQKTLWRSNFINRLIAPSFDSKFEGFIRKGRVARLGLGSIFGVRILDVGDDWIVVRQSPFEYKGKGIGLGGKVRIEEGESETVGHFRVKLLDCKRNKARISLCFGYKEWEEKMMQYIQSKYGSITVTDMMNWSRLHSKDLGGLRGMCGEKYRDEAAMIYKIPEKNYEIMSEGWFAANHPCSSIYVPVHICNNDIYDPYETGEAAELCLNLLNEYGHGILETNFTKVEEVFLNEINEAEQISTEQIENDLSISDFLTIIDIGMQKQAFLTEEIWMEAIRVSNPYKKKAIIGIIATLWDTNYTNSLDEMKNALLDLEEVSGSDKIKEKIVDIALDICKSRIDAANAIGKQIQTAEEEYEAGSELIKQGKYESGFDSLQKAFTRSDMLIKGQTLKDLKSIETEKNKEVDPFLYVLIFVLIFAILAFILRLRLDSQ